MFATELRVLARLSLPIVITQLSQMLMGTIDAVMAGHVDKNDLAGVSIGGALFWPVMVMASGLLMAVTPSVSQLHGAGRSSQAGEVVRQALWLGLIGGLVGLVLLHFAGSFYARWGVDPVAIPVATAYVGYMSWGLLPVLGYFALRYLCDGMSFTRAAMFIAVSALLLKLPLTYLLVFGGLGVKAMGGAGCGLATAIVMALELVAMLWVVRVSRVRAAGFYERFSWPNWAEVARLARLGLPIGLAIFFEMAIFAFVTLMIAKMGAQVVAAHQIVANIGSITFMIPLGLGMAASIRVGFNVGQGDYVAARRSGLAAIALALGVACVCMLLLVIFREPLVGLYGTDSAVLGLAASLVLFVAAFQLFDAAQVSAIGALRGFKDTRFPMVTALGCYWGVAVPMGFCLAFGKFGLQALGAHGFWMALTIGLGLAAFVLGSRFQWLSQRPHKVAEFAQR